MAKLSEYLKINQKTQEELIQKIKNPLHTSQQTFTENPLVAEDKQDRITDRKLKRMYANWFKWILIIQLVIMNGIFVFSGIGILKFSDWELKLYMGGTLTEIFGIVWIITSHLFPNKIRLK